MISSGNIIVLVGVLSFILVCGGILIYEYTIGYPVFLDNCDSILSTDYQTATEDVSQCLKAINHPIVNYWLIVYIGGVALAMMISLGIVFLVSIRLGVV